MTPQIFQAHDGTDHFSAKVLQQAAGHASSSSSYDWMKDGCPWWIPVCDVLGRLPIQLQHDSLNDLMARARLPFAIVPKGERPEEPILMHYAGMLEYQGGFFKMLIRDMQDGKIDDHEFAQLDPAWALIERMVSQVRIEMNARRSRVRIAR